MEINGTLIDDTFAEAFSMRFTRLTVTATDEYWLNAALQEFCGYGSSVIGCDAEVGVERYCTPGQTVDRRPGADVLAFAFSQDQLGRAVVNRVGQCLMTCPTTAVMNGLPGAEKKIPLGSHLRYFGDGFQKSKLIGGIRYWRIPVMDGEFVVEESAGVSSGVAGGNFLIQSVDQPAGLLAARAAISEIQKIEGVITPFPGGVVRSGSKVGSKYPNLKGSTADAYCPTLRGRTETNVDKRANCVYEIVIDGVDFDSVERAMLSGIRAAIGDGVVAISAGNYGGKLGKHKYRLREMLTKQA